ncbi:MAG: RNA polymerase sigma factor, partial [Actinobacteria bacterium]|nr:RNA polymerase sigma factor [Actinomycetota bacterium]
MARTAVRPAAKPTSDEALFDAWFARHRDELRSYSIRLTGDAATAEDVVQETFARAWCNLPQLREREEIGPWLYRVARNLCVDTHRARRRVVTSDDLPAWAEESDGAEASDPLRNIERAEECAAVREALGALSDRHRDVLYLRDIVGMAYDEVGERHGVSGESARAVLARARRRLREELKTMGNGIFGAAIWLRLRVDGVLRRAGGDRIPVEPLTAAVAQYLTVVAAAVGMAFGPMVVGADADGASGAPSEAGAQS